VDDQFQWTQYKALHANYTKNKRGYPTENGGPWIFGAFFFIPSKNTIPIRFHFSTKMLSLFI